MHCISCGKRFSTTDATARVAARHAQTAGREVCCHKCGNTHGIPRYIHSTRCPTCDAEIVIGDFSLTSHAARPIDLRGCLWIGMKASLAGHEAFCTDAIIEGALDGNIVCENSIEFRNSARLTNRLRAQRMRVVRDVRIEFGGDCEVENLDIEGIVDGDIVATGLVTVQRTGQLLGTVTASSVQVERGGIWNGKGKIGDYTKIPPPPNKVVFEVFE